ncbi:MAG: hypothetical protein AUH85_07365 [Chloroflexi bacterium 13_1_40CM_4_68_4]|nr:MAG: hypothetical protein AUH85_07365 [Chloroflexi bacterium 13_1_40CM_4_68_4]
MRTRWRDPLPTDAPAPPETPLRVGSREELVYLLAEACELEHGLMCEYLYAQFSLKRSLDEGLTGPQLARIQAWEESLIAVIKQEMLHLALSTNLLTSLGAAPHFHRPNFPILSRWYPPGVQVALVPFGERALRHFIYLERPEGIALDDAEGFAAADKAAPLMDDTLLMAVAEDFQTVGHLYRGIEDGLGRLVERYGEANVFIGPARAQATTEIFEWPELTAVTDLVSAKRAIELIVEQGEGARGDWRNAHFGVFVSMLDEYLAMRAADPHFEPAREVVPAYVTLPPDVADDQLTISAPLTAEVADLFSAVYQTTLQALTRFFVHSTETPAQVDALARTAKHLMSWVMRPLGAVLTTLPRSESDSRGVGPTFQMVEPTLYFLPHRDAAWRILSERIAEVDQRMSALASAVPALAPIEVRLRSIVEDVATNAAGTAR